MKYGDYEYKHITEEIEGVDDDVLEDYLHAMLEVRELKSRKRILQNFIDKNAEKCERYLWTNQLGQVVNIKKIDDNYLINLTKFLARSPRWGYDQETQDRLDALAKEIKKRGLEIKGVELLEMKGGEK